LERKALLVGIGEGMKLGEGEAGREARPDKRWEAWRLARAGACRYLLKDLHSRELIRAIEAPQIASPQKQERESAEPSMYKRENVS